MQRVFLVGARASGKSTIGRSLAETLGCPFLDTDKELTRDLGCSIDVFVKENGWDAFRRKGDSRWAMFGITSPRLLIQRLMLWEM